MLLESAWADYSGRDFRQCWSKGEHFLHGCFPSPLLHFYLVFLKKRKLHPLVTLVILKVTIDHGSVRNLKGPLTLYYQVVPGWLNISTDPNLSLLIHLPLALLHVHVPGKRGARQHLPLLKCDVPFCFSVIYVVCFFSFFIFELLLHFHLTKIYCFLRWCEDWLVKVTTKIKEVKWRNV